MANQRRGYSQETASDLAGVKGETITVTSPATPNTEFLIIHGLRRVPTTLQLLLKQVPGDLYANRMGEWTKRRTYAKFSNGADSLTVRIA